MLGLIDANSVLRAIKNHALQGHNEEITRIIQNLVDLDRARQGEFPESEKDTKIEECKDKLLSELGMVRPYPEVVRVDKSKED